MIPVVRVARRPSHRWLRGRKPDPERAHDEVLAAIKRGDGPVVRRDRKLLIVALAKPRGTRAETLTKCMKDAA